MKWASSALLYCHCIKSVTDGYYVLCDLFVYYINWMGMMSKMVVSKVDMSYCGQVMATFLLACKEMATRMKKFLIWMVPLSFVGWFCQWYCFNLMVSNNISAFLL